MEAAHSAGAPVPGSYADSVDSLSPRSRGGESWDEPLPAAPKLRLMCSYGGHIVPRPHDKSLCYLGGETRIVAVDRHATLADIHARLSRSLLGGLPFSLKYQLPSEDLDSLISVATDEDLDNMVEEYDRIAAASSGARHSRLRLFLFPAKPDPPAGMPSSASSSIAAGGSLLDDSSKSETWFVDALNGAMPMLGHNHSSADSAASSVNCLLGLEDSYPSPNAAAAGGPAESEGGQLLFPRPDSSGKLAGGGRHGAQDVQSMPDSPMLETASSFGSASSAPSLSSLPPIRVRPEDADPRAAVDAAGVEEQFALMNISGQQQKLVPPPTLDVEGFKHHLQHFPPPPHLHSINPIALAATDAPGETPTSVSPTENPKPSTVIAASVDDKSPQGEIWRSPPQQAQHQQQPQQQLQEQLVLENSKVLDVPISGDAISRSVYCQERPSNASDLQQQETHFDPSYRFPVHVTEQGYLMHQPSPLQPPLRAVDQLQQQPLQQQAQQQQRAVPHLATHHHPTGSVLPIPSYYNQMLIHPQQQVQQVAAHAYSPQVPLFFLPVHHGSAYNLPVQPKLGDSVATASVPSTSKPIISPPSSVLPPHVAPAHKQELPTNLYRTGLSAPPLLQQPPQPTKLIHLDQSHQYVGYHPLQHPTSQSAASTQAATGYGYEYVDAVQAYQMYYTPASSAGLPPQYQMMSAGAVTAEPPLALQQPTDAKQTNRS